MSKYYDRLVKINESLDKELKLAGENVDPNSSIVKKIEKAGLSVSFNTKGIEVSYAYEDEKECKDIFERLCALCGLIGLLDGVTTEKLLNGKYETHGILPEDKMVQEGSDDGNTIEIPRDSLTPEQKKDILLDKGVDQKTIDNLKDDKEIDGALDATLNNKEVESESGRDPLVDYLQEHANVRSENDCVNPELAVDMVSDILKTGHPYHIKTKMGFTQHFMQYGKSKYRFVIVRRTHKNMVIYKDDEPGEFYALDNNLTNEEFFKQIAGFIRKLGVDKGLCESSLDDSDVSEEVVIRMDDDDLDMHGFVKGRDGKELELTDNEEEAEKFQHEELGQNTIEAICAKFHYDPTTFTTKSVDPRADEPYVDDEDGENWVSLDSMHPGASVIP